MARTAYDAGLSHFPDNGQLAQRVSGWTDFLALAPIPGASQIAAGVNLATSATGGTATDQQRQARVDWTVQQAQAGSTTAAAIIIAGPANTASHEAPMWRAALGQVPDVVLQSAYAQYPSGYWPVGQADFYTDTAGATHQRIVSEVRQASSIGLAMGGAVSGGVNAITNAVTRQPATGWLVGALVVGGLLLSKRR